MRRVNRQWGYYIDLLRCRYLCIKILAFAPMSMMSVQRHFYRMEIWLGLNVWMLRWVWPCSWHTYANYTLWTVYFLEIQLGKPREEDIERK